MIYTVFTGEKFKGCWTDKALALGYMAARSEEERKAWRLVAVDLANSLDAEVEEAVALKTKQAKESKESKAVHHLHAEGIEMRAKGKVTS